MPIKMYEYMVCGKPVISTRLPSIMKEFGHDNAVIYVDQPMDVLKKVIELCNDHRSVRKHGNKARKLVEKYSWDKVTRGFEDVLNSLVKDAN